MGEAGGAEVVAERRRAAPRPGRAPCRAAARRVAAGRGGSSAASARRRTPSTAPATPAAARPVATIRAARSEPCAPRTRSQASCGPSRRRTPRTPTTSPVVAPAGHGTPGGARTSSRRPPTRASADDRAARPGARRLEEHRVTGHRRAVAHARRRGVERREPRLAAERPGQHRGDQPGREHASPRAGHGERDRGQRRDRARRPRPRQQPGDERRQPGGGRSRLHHRERVPEPRGRIGGRPHGRTLGRGRPDALTAAGGAGAPRAASARCRGPGRGRRPTGSRRARRARRGSSARWPGRRRRACRAARPWRC